MTISREETILQATKIVELIGELEAEGCEDYPILTSYLTDIINWADATSGTYQINCSNGTIKEFNL